MPIRLLILLSCMFSHVAAEKEKPAPIDQGALVVGRLEEREVVSATPHRWRIDVAEGQYAEASVENAGIDVSISVTSPSAGRALWFDHAGYAGTQIVRWLAEEGGTWTMQLAAIGGDARGKYRLKLGILRTGTERDKKVTDADRLTERAGELQKKEAYAEAEALFQRALQTVEEVAGRESADVAVVAANLADHYYVRGRLGESAALLGRALTIVQREFGPDSAEAGVAMNNLGFIYHMQGRLGDAERLLRRGLEVRARVLGWKHPRVGITLDNLAGLYIALGRYAEAELMATRALTIFEDALGRDHYYVAFPLRILANIQQDHGQYAAAEPLLKRAVEIDQARLGRDHSNFASSLRGLALNVSDQGRHEEAESMFREVVTINEKVHGPNHPATAVSITDLARIRRVRGDLGESRRLYERALRIEKEAYGPNHPNLAMTLIGLVRVELLSTTPDIKTAEAHIDEAIVILERSGGYPASTIHAYALRSELRRRRKENDRAVADLAEALRRAEILRPQSSGGEETRAALFDYFMAYYDQMVDWQLDAGRVDIAFEYAERARARAFLDQLAAGQVDLRSSIPPDLRTELENRENASRSRIAELQQRINMLRSRSDLDDQERGRQIGAVETSLRDAHDEYNRVYALIKDASSLWRDEITTRGRAPSLDAVQRELVPRDGLMLLYQVGAANSHLFVIPPAGQTSVSLPLTISRDQARVLGVSAGSVTSASLDRVLNRPEDTREGGAGLVTMMGSHPSRGLAAAGAELPVDRLHALWQVLVPDAVRKQLLTSREVVIIPDASLHALPFEVLVTALGANGGATRYWLDDGPVTRYAPSAAVLFNLMRRPSMRSFPSDAATVLSVSNPIYSPAEVAAQRGAETRLSTSAPGALPAVTTRNAYERFGGSLIRLPGTALETEAILAAYQAEAFRTVHVLQELRADEPGVRGALTGKRYLHIATHALVGGNRGTLFAALVLTPPAGATSDPNADGFLQLHEIYELKLAGVDLAILSACDTNRGKTMDNEGVFALSRGFLAAGAHRVIASQWAVNDASTAQLISVLFRQAIEDERNARPVDFARALRDARRAIRSQPAWSHPYYWAPFVLTGRQ